MWYWDVEMVSSGYGEDSVGCRNEWFEEGELLDAVQMVHGFGWMWVVLLDEHENEQ